MIDTFSVLIFVYVLYYYISLFIILNKVSDNYTANSYTIVTSKRIATWIEIVQMYNKM